MKDILGFEQLATEVDFEVLAEQLDRYAKYLNACYLSADEEGCTEDEKMGVLVRLNNAMRMREELSKIHDV